MNPEERLVRDLLDGSAGKPAISFLRRFDHQTRDVGFIQKIRLMRMALEPMGLRDARDLVQSLEDGDWRTVAALAAPFLAPKGTWTPCPQPWTAGVPTPIAMPPGWSSPWSSADPQDVAVLADYLERQADPRGAALARATWAKAIGVDAYGPWAIAGLPAGTIRMRWIPGGVFQRGRPGSVSSMRPHTVRLTRGFWLAETALIADRLGNRRPDDVSGIRGQPAYFVGWRAAQQIIAALRDECPARLPTEAEWECACRAGTPGDTWLGPLATVEQRDDAASFAVQRPVAPVAQGVANPIGLYDMIGGVGEWVADGLSAYPGDSTDPIGAGDRRLYRGALTAYGRHIANHDNPGNHGYAPIGMRIAISA